MKVYKFFSAAAVLFATALPGFAQNVSSQGTGQIGEPAPLVVWNRRITVFRGYYEGVSPEQRAVRAGERIAALPEMEAEWNVEATETSVGKYSGALITVNAQVVFGIILEDLDSETGETLQDAYANAVARLREALEARSRQRSGPLLLRGIGLSIASTLVALFLGWLIVRVRRRLLEETPDQRANRLTLVGVDLQPQVTAVKRGAVKVAAGTAGITLAYLWLTYVLTQFPYSQPWGDELGTFLINLFVRLGTGALKATPGIFTVVVIFLLTRIVVRIVDTFFREVGEGDVVVSWLQPETAGATRRLAVVLIWVFALTIAYPYIPGSSSDAFKGVSVFVGLMVSLGSAGMINQILSGLVVIYSRALKPGDFVRIGDDEGVVSAVGLLSTKLVTRKREEITIPNAVMVGDRTVNYSRLAGEEGAPVGTTVTIGYDAPWRQVQALLIRAAQQTAGVRKDPGPRVFQKALSDFYVEYHLVVNLERPEERVSVLSELHANIQDQFNEYGVQIMSPAFESQPDGKVFVPKSQWFSEPAKEDVTQRAGEPPPTASTHGN
jgi:small-conductance mechanosensitive channel